MKPLSHERLAQVLDYDPDTGIFRWKIRKNNRGALAGALAGRITKPGYLSVSLDYGQYYLHRLAWFYVYRRWPDRHIDHINGNPADNRIANLREATSSQNQANSRMPITNTTGFKGVYRRYRRYRRWTARIKVNKRLLWLGSFADPQSAHEAYKQAAIRHFGSFARTE